LKTPSDHVRAELLEAIPNLRAFAISLCGDVVRADDLVQEALLRAWGNIGSYQEGTNLKAWLFTILRNNYFSMYRKQRREIEDVHGNVSSRLAVHPEQLGHMDFEDFWSALRDLPDDQREALILVTADGMSYQDAARICDCAVGTIKSRVNRGRTRLARVLDIKTAAEFGPDKAAEAVLSQSTSVRQRA
jgi:RNA polymerase sigma-70 factor, ECF subfamily